MRDRHLGFVAAAATLLAAAPLSTIYERWTWLIQCAVAVALIAGAATLTRTLRGPVWAQFLAMVGTLVMVLTLMFSSGEELLAVIPTPGTFSHFGSMLSFAVEDMRSFGVPVPDRPGLQFITVLGVGSVGILVDLLTVGLRRPALAGLPMLAIYSVPVAVYTESVHPLPFVIGAVGFLWLLVADNVDRVRRFGRRFTGDGRDVDVWEPSPLAAAGRRLAVVGVALAVLLPLAVPGMTNGLLANFGQGGTGPGTGRGTGGRVDLFANLSGELLQSEEKDLVKVTTDDPNPQYLRFGVADQLTNDGFRSGGRSVGQPIDDGLPAADKQGITGVSNQRHTAQVEITDDFDMGLLPVYAAPVDADGIKGTWFYDPGRGIVYSTSSRTRSKGQKYTFNFVRTSYSAAALRNADPVPSTDPAEQFTTMPENQQVQDRVDQLVRGKTNAYDKVRAIYDFFSADNGFTYSLQAGDGTSGNAIVDFLTDRKGFCQQYAAAMAWMVRAAGIPARVAFGFSSGSNKRSGNTFTLTNKNLHAWTEVYFGADLGWIPFDATPAAGVAGSIRTDYAPDVDAPETPAPSASGSTGPVPGATGGTTGPQEDLGDQSDLGAGVGSSTPTSPKWPWFTISAVILLLALLCVPAMRRSLLRRQRRTAFAGAGAAVDVGGPDAPRIIVTDVAAAGRAREDAHAAWAELLDTMVDFRVPIDPTETPRATADRLQKDGLVDGSSAEAAQLLGRAEERARYARDPLQAGRLGDGLRAVRRSLAGRANRRTRLAAFLLPPSVLMRWRQAIVESSIRTVLRSGRLRDTMLRWSPRRLLTSSRPARPDSSR
ncbi:transglutaminaseTgpA domain-containing protein [Phytohabitans rumicis]|uniref:Transglutaminase n=1 Tax=Phytohabitans rumicis TaxID=1076125 RepID=A0A6V8KZ52_9ACTN|nr:transglutaminaseTgpA domain-containing protein [Phytohabitans rumicis]GFJ88630.1 transglutaminase [Phytohabitans rumicis]